MIINWKRKIFKDPKENRICSSCYSIEDEKHFHLECTKKKINLRNNYIQKAKTEDSSNNFDTMTEI